jgi:hypothetical protein
MHVPLTIGDFLERAALVHGADRVAIVDEPGVAGSLGATGPGAWRSPSTPWASRPGSASPS